MEKTKKNQRKELAKAACFHNCWLVNSLNYAPYKRCQYCELKFQNCLFLHYQIISIVLATFFIVLSFLIDKNLSWLVIMAIFTLVIVYGYFFSNSTDKIIKANFTEKKARKELKELSKNLEKKVKKQTQLIQNQLEQIKSLSRAREDFIEIASHQLRTPISGAASFMSSFVDGTLDKESPEQRKEDYKLIYKSMHKLQDVVNQLLDALAVQKIQGLKLVNKKFYDVKEEIARIFNSKSSTINIEAEEKQINFQISQFPKKINPIWVDAYYFNSALESLIDNALKYSPAKNEKNTINIFLAVEQVAKIKAELEKNKITAKNKALTKKILKSLSALPKYDRIFFFLIKDFGAGISKKEQKQIIKFQPFQRAKKARLLHTDGTGLSLYLANKIVQAHQGQLFLYSPGENKGTTAWFWIKAE